LPSKKLNLSITLLSFHQALLILVNLRKISIYFFIALLCLLYPLMTLQASCLKLLLNSSLTRFKSSKQVYLSIVFLPLLPFLQNWLHLTFHPSLVIPLMTFLNSSLSFLTPIVIWILFLHLSRNNVLISYFLLLLTSSICLSTGIFLAQFKNCSVHLYLKKYNLGKDNLCNYRPIFHLSVLSKLTKRVVKLRLADYLSTNNLLNSFYIKHHST